MKVKMNLIKYFLSVVCVFLTHTTFASHIMGGMVGVFQKSQDSTTVGVWLVTDGGGLPSPQSITVEQWEMNSVGWYTLTSYITLTQGTTPISFQGQTLVNYTSEYLDLDSNKYRFIYKNCCWGMINNSQNSFNSEFVISADYWHIPNNSTPYSRSPFIINQQVDTLNTMKPIWGWNAFLNEVDNDVVTISQGDLYSSYSNGTFVPQIFTPLSLHVDNDSVSWTPTTLGRYATGFEIKDMRNGAVIGIQRVQWSFLVVNSTVGIEEFNNQSYNVYPNPSYDYITVDNDGIIYNNLGQQVMVVKKGLNDISTLQKGIYYISKTKIIKL